MSFAGAGFSSGSALNGRNSANTADATLPTVASATAGTTTYYAAAEKVLNSITRNSAARSVSVTVINAPSIGTVTAPTNVFASSAFSMSWSGTNAVNYKIRGNLATSGVSTSDVDLGTSTSSSITPTAAGTYTYTITATNAVGVTTTTTKSVVVESDPTISSASINSGVGFVNVSTGAALYPSATLSSGASLVSTVPTYASTNPGEYTYNFYATKNLNGVTRYSNTIQSKIGAGIMHNLYVGHYYGNPSPDTVYGAIVSQSNGWTAIVNGAVSPSSYGGYSYIAVYANQDPNLFILNIDAAAPDGILLNKKVSINGVLCNQTLQYYGFYGVIDTYQYQSCTSGLVSAVGSTVKLYVQN